MLIKLFKDHKLVSREIIDLEIVFEIALKLLLLH